MRSPPRGNALSTRSRAPGIARLIEVKVNFAAGEINNVGGSGAIDIRETDAAVRQINPGCQTKVTGPSRLWRRSVHSPDSASSRPRHCECAPGPSGRLRTCPRGRSIRCHLRRRAAGLSLRRRLVATRCAGPNPSAASEVCQQKAWSSLISRSGKPSPVRSMNFKLGFRQSNCGSDGKGLERLPVRVIGAFEESRRRAHRTPPGRVCHPRKDPSIAAVRCSGTQAKAGARPPRTAPNCGSVICSPSTVCWFAGL